MAFFWGGISVFDFGVFFYTVGGGTRRHRWKKADALSQFSQRKKDEHQHKMTTATQNTFNLPVTWASVTVSDRDGPRTRHREHPRRFLDLTANEMGRSWLMPRCCLRWVLLRP